MRIFNLIAGLCFLPAASLAQPPNVVADILPIHSLVAQIMVGVGEPGLVLKPGASPHYHALRPSEAQMLADADLIFWGGDILTPWLKDPLETLISSGAVVDLLDAPGTQLLDNRAQQHDDGDIDTDHGQNPHAWLDPTNGKIWLNAIANALTTIDPDNSQLYRQNELAGIAQIEEATANARAALDSPSSRAVFHDTYQYFEAYFGLPAPVIISESHAVLPGASRLQDVRDVFLNGGVTCLLSEPGVSPKLLRRLTENTDIIKLESDPLGAKLPSGPAHYPALIEDMARVIARCSR